MVPSAVAPTIREVTGWMTRHPPSLDEGERLRLKALPARSRSLETANGLAASFAQMPTARTGHDLPEWIDAAVAADLPGLRRFARGHQRRNRLQHVTPEPKPSSGGRCRQAMPV